MAFLVRMPQNFERFEQSGSQIAILPSRVLEYASKQAPLLF
jgi:hypothetical protein